MLNKHGIKLTSKRRVRQAYMAAADKIALPWQDTAGTSAKRSKRPVVFAAVRAAACVALVIALGAVATGVFRTPDTTGKTGSAPGSGNAAAGNNFTLSVLAADAPTTPGTASSNSASAASASGGIPSGTALKPGVEITLPAGQLFDSKDKNNNSIWTQMNFVSWDNNGGFHIDGSNIQSATVSTQDTSGVLIANDKVNEPAYQADWQKAMDEHDQAWKSLQTEAEKEQWQQNWNNQHEAAFTQRAAQIWRSSRNDTDRFGNLLNPPAHPLSLTFTGNEVGNFIIQWNAYGPGSDHFTNIDIDFAVTFTDGTTQTKTATMHRDADTNKITTYLKTE